MRAAGSPLTRGSGGGRSERIQRLTAEFFRTLGHPVRVRMLELLREGERTVGELQAALALDSSGASQHLTIMRRHGLLDSRRAGTSVYYRLKDPHMLQLLEVARQILTAQLQESQALLDDLAATPSRLRRDGQQRKVR